MAHSQIGWVDRNDIEDDDLGQYAPLFQEMGMSTQSKSDLLTFGLLAEGFTTDCYDGQPFFDTDHPVLDKNGELQSVSNMTSGANTPWFLMSTKRPLKPLIYQNRKHHRSGRFSCQTGPKEDLSRASPAADHQTKTGI